MLGNPLQNVDALRATRPVHLRHAPNRTETRALLQAARRIHRRLRWSIDKRPVIATHESPRTTKLYDHTSDEIEPIAI